MEPPRMAATIREVAPSLLRASSCTAHNSENWHHAADGWTLAPRDISSDASSLSFPYADLMRCVTP